MYVLGSTVLSPDRAFTANGIKYPSNWLRLSTAAEREAIGIRELPDPASYDQRFYWGYDADGVLIPKDHAQLVDQWTQQTRTTANTLLAPTDWMVVRELDNGTTMDAAWKDWRQAVRLAANEKVLHIGATNDTAELAAYITGTDYHAWPNDPNTPVVDAPADGVQPAGDQPTV